MPPAAAHAKWHHEYKHVCAVLCGYMTTANHIYCRLQSGTHRRLHPSSLPCWYCRPASTPAARCWCCGSIAPHCMCCSSCLRCGGGVLPTTHAVSVDTTNHICKHHHPMHVLASAVIIDRTQTMLHPLHLCSHGAICPSRNQEQRDPRTLEDACRSGSPVDGVAVAVKGWSGMCAHEAGGVTNTAGTQLSCREWLQMQARHTVSAWVGFAPAWTAERERQSAA